MDSSRLTIEVDTLLQIDSLRTSNPMDSSRLTIKVDILF